MRPSSTGLTTGSIPRTLFTFALPILMGNVLQSINGSINSIWVGKFLGTAALTATNNANIVMFLLLGSVFGITMASTILIAQNVGARKSAEAKRVVGTSATFFMVLACCSRCSARSPARTCSPGWARRTMHCRWRSPTCA